MYSSISLSMVSLTRAHAVTQEVSGVINQMERERRPTPLAWQVKSDSAEAVEMRKRAAREAREQAQRLKAVVDRAAQKRKMLVLQVTADAKVQQERRAAELNVAQKLKAAGLLSGNAALAGGAAGNDDDDYAEEATDAELGLMDDL